MVRLGRMRWCLLIGTLVAAFGQDTKMVVRQRSYYEKGPFHVEFPTGQIVVSAEGEEWTIDLEKLPLLPSDCQQPQCKPLSARIDGVAENPPRLYLTATTEIGGKNLPVVLFEANFRSRTIRRILGNEPNLSKVVVSPSGRYLAYATYFSMGACSVTSSVWVTDLQGWRTGRDTAQVAADGINPRVQAEPVQWNDDAHLVIQKRTFPGDNLCGEHEEETKTVDVGSLHWPVK